MSVLASLWEAVPATSIANCWNKSTVFEFDPAGALPPAPVATTATVGDVDADHDAEVQALATEVAIVAGQTDDIAIGQYETLATQLEEQISDLFEQARAGGDVAGLLVDWVNLENMKL